MPEKLKPCPFCGCRAVTLSIAVEGNPFYYVYCSLCFATSCRAMSAGVARDRWNRRPPKPKPKKRSKRCGSG